MGAMLTTERLLLRAWRDEDEPALARLCADPEVMRHFPRPMTADEVGAFLERQRAQLAARGHCYFAAEHRESGRLVGFVGLSHQTYEAAHNPSVDIGWRLAREVWGQGLATEGARACLELAFGELALPLVVAVAPAVNRASLRVMEKLGMTEAGTFEHPCLVDCPRLQPCVLYEARRGR